MTKEKITNLIEMMSAQELKSRLAAYMMNDVALMPKPVAIQVRLSSESNSSCRYDVLLIDEDGCETMVKFPDRPSRLIYIYTLMHPQGFQRYSVRANNYYELRQLYRKLYFRDDDALMKTIGETDDEFDHFLSQAIAQSRVAIRNTGFPTTDIKIGSPKTYGRVMIPLVKNTSCAIIDTTLQ